MKPQETFDFIAGKLRGMNGRAVSPEGVCCYLNKAGERCAVGHLIPLLSVSDGDRALMDRFEGSVGSFIPHFRGLGVLPQWFIDQQQMLAELQSVHDASTCWRSDIGGPRLIEMSSRLQMVADDHKLTFDPAAWMHGPGPTEAELTDRAEAGIDA